MEPPHYVSVDVSSEYFAYGNTYYIFHRKMAAPHYAYTDVSSE
jgi:hypothetical protein